MRSLLLGLALGAADAATLDAQHKVNPIRKVVTMMQMMENKVAADGEKKQAIYDKFMCYCDNADTILGGAIAEAEKKIPLLESAIGEDGALKVQLDADIKQHAADRAEAKGAVAKATALREKEAGVFSKTSSDLKTNIDALAKAIPAISKGLSGFLQTSSASVVRELSINMDMSSVDREMLAAFLSNKAGYAPAGGEILGILKNMDDEMKADLADATNTENGAISAFEALVAAKTKEINALQAAIESKMTRVGELGVKVAEMTNDLTDTKEDLAESKKFLADLDVNCATKKKEWAEYQKMQSMELLALADTIKVLNDDDALELFKKALPSAASFMQVKVSSRAMVQKAAAFLRQVKDHRVDFLELALRGGKQGFGKIIKMIDQLTAQLVEEQKIDNQKKETCLAELDKTEDKKKGLLNDASDLEAAIEDEKEGISTYKGEIEALDDGIRAMDKEVAEATENRAAEHKDFVATLAGNTAAVDLLKFAKNRLNKFYNPSQYKAPPKRELSEDERITLNMGGTLAPTDAPGGIAGTGIGLIQGRAAPPPPPAADLAYKTKGEESGGVIQLIDNIVNDVEKESQVMELEEKDSQKDYEKFISDASNKRAEDSTSLTDKQDALANTEEALVSDKQNLHDTNIELMNTEKYLGEVHADCDWLLKYFDVRKEARTGEIDAMGKAKDVLSGADYSF